ncbi:MAG: DMT family transporter [Streptococcus sp.]|nr:DMT family transporter [Streptococcus sp.]
MVSFFIIGIIGGMFIPLQTLINSKLNSHTHSLIYTSNISFFVGVIFLLVLNLFINPNLINPSSLFNHKIDLHWFLGGTLGIVYLTGNQLSLHKIGSSLTVVMTLMGQLIMGLIIDSFGLFGIKQLPFTFFKILAVILFILGAILLNKKDANINKCKKNKSLWLALAILFGFCPPIQNVINHQLGVIIHSPFLASFISFLVGFVILTILTILTNRSFKIYKFDEQAKKIKPIDFLGGVLGVGFVTINLIVVSIVGTATTTILGFLGQIFIAIIIDNFGLLGVKKNPINNRIFLGLILIISGIFLIRF